MNTPSLRANSPITTGKETQPMLHSTLSLLLTNISNITSAFCIHGIFLQVFWITGIKILRNMFIIKISFWVYNMKNLLNTVLSVQNERIILSWCLRKTSKSEVQLRGKKKKNISSIQIGCGGLLLGKRNSSLSLICTELNTDSSSMTRVLKHCSNINPRVGMVDLY